MAELRGVLDSNLIATALVSPHGPGNALLNAARLDRFQLVVSAEILEEVHRTLVDDFDVTAPDAHELVMVVQRIAEMSTPNSYARRLSRDPDDDHVLALAEASGAAFLATYDHDLMAVGSIAGCGVIHPLTALQLVRNLTPDEWYEGLPTGA